MTDEFEPPLTVEEIIGVSNVEELLVLYDRVDDITGSGTSPASDSRMEKWVVYSGDRAAKLFMEEVMPLALFLRHEDIDVNAQLKVPCNSDRGDAFLQGFREDGKDQVIEIVTCAFDQERFEKLEIGTSEVEAANDRAFQEDMKRLEDRLCKKLGKQFCYPPGTWLLVYISEQRPMNKDKLRKALVQKGIEMTKEECLFERVYLVSSSWGDPFCKRIK